jgi:hypothetical protein
MNHQTSDTQNMTNQSDVDAVELGAALRTEIGSCPSSHWYVLIDAAQIPDLAVAMRKGSLCHLPHISLFDLEAENQGAGADAAPYLFYLGGEGDIDRAITYTVQKSLNTYGISWLISPLDLHTLAARLAQRTEAKLTENMEVLLRFYDTRILPHLHFALSPEQANIFYSVAQAWWYVTRAGKLQECKTQFREEDKFRAPLLFTQGEENVLTTLAFPDAVLGKLLEEVPELITTMHRAEQHNFVMRQLDRLQTMGITAMPDIMIYCVICLREGDDFVERSPWIEKWEAIKLGQHTMSGLLQ